MAGFGRSFFASISLLILSSSVSSSSSVLAVESAIATAAEVLPPGWSALSTCFQVVLPALGAGRPRGQLVPASIPVLDPHL